VPGGAASSPGGAGVAPEPYVFDHERWERLRRDQFGIDVIDPDGHDIGMTRAINHRWYTWELRFAKREVNWSPVDGVKHVLIGEFDSFDTSDDAGGDEWDWEIRIVPDPPFRFILDRVVALMPASDRDQYLVARERGQGPCVECEVTPDEDFRSGFPGRWGPRPGEKVAVYGPWVRDFGHGGRPEIHPCEALWWLGEPRQGVATSRLVAVVQDDSDRFDWPCDFDAPVTRPWSAFPRRASITFALRPARGQYTEYDLRILDSREMAGAGPHGTASVIGTFDGQPVLTVIQLIEDPDRIGMSLSPVVADPDGVHLRCFLTLDVQVSDADRGRAGHALLNLETLAPAVSPRPGQDSAPGL
jgi:hypothetical protein